MKTSDISEVDVLAQLDRDAIYGNPTFVVRNGLVLSKAYPRTLKTRQVLAKLKKMEAKGLVFRANRSYPNSICWVKAWGVPATS